MAEDARKFVVETLSDCSGHTHVLAHVAPPIDGPIVHDVASPTTSQHMGPRKRHHGHHIWV